MADVEPIGSRNVSFLPVVSFFFRAAGRCHDGRGLLYDWLMTVIFSREAARNPSSCCL